METKIGHYYVFLSANDFWEKVNFWKNKGYYWVYENHPLYNPTVTDKDMPCILAIDSKTMGWGKVEAHKEKYFSDPTFVLLYKQELRKKKLNRILK